MPALNIDYPEVDDTFSVRGRFCWEVVADACLLCFIRGPGMTKYIPVSVGESQVLRRYLKHFSPELFECIVVESFQLTSAEINLLNSINKEHCCNQLNPRKFTKEKESLVRLQDFREYYEFLDTCYRKLKQISFTDGRRNRCGFMKLNNESVVPYIVKDGITYMPLFYFEGDTLTLGEKTIDIRGWDLAYLKFCCKMQGIRNTIFNCDVCAMVSYDVIKSYFPENTVFEDYWPTELRARMLLSHTLREVVGNPWISTPSFGVSTTTGSVSIRSAIEDQVEFMINNSASATNGRQNGVVTQRIHNSTPAQISPTGAHPVSNRVPPQHPHFENGIQNTPPVMSPNMIVTNGIIHPYGPSSNMFFNQASQMSTSNGSHMFYGSGVTINNGSQSSSQINNESQSSSQINNESQSSSQIAISNGCGQLRTYNRDQCSPQMEPLNGGDRVLLHAPPMNGERPSLSHTTPMSGGHQLPVSPQVFGPRGSVAKPNGITALPAIKKTTPPAVVPPLRIIRAVNGTFTTDPKSAELRDVNPQKRPVNTRTPDVVIDLISPPSSPRHPYAEDVDRQSTLHLPHLVLLPKVDGASYVVTTTCLHGLTMCVLDTVSVSSLQSPNPFIPLCDIVEHFNTTMESLRLKLQVGLQLILYQANEEQQRLLYKHKKCASMYEELPLILLNDFNSRFTHLKYLYNNENLQPTKRTKHC